MGGSVRKPKKAKTHKHKYREEARGLFICRCGRALALGFAAQTMIR